MKYDNLQQAREAYAVKSAYIDNIFKTAHTSVDGKESYDLMRCTELSGDMQARVEKIRELNKDLDDTKDQLDAFLDIDRAQKNAAAGVRASTEPVSPFIHPMGGERALDAPRKTIGELFVESTEYAEFKALRNWPRPVSLPNTTIKDALYYTTGAPGGWPPQVLQIPRVELSPQTQPDVLDYIPQLTTTQSAVAYMEETTFTNTAAETAEAAAVAAADLIPEATLDMTLRTVPVEWIPVFIPVTMQQLDDVEGVAAYLNQRLTLMIRQRLNLQVLQGTGVPPLLMGTEGLATHLTQAKAADPTPDAIYKAFVQIRTTGQAEPSVLFANSSDWQDVRLLRTVDGMYIWGSPAEAGPSRIWGVPVVETAAALAGTMITGDYTNYSALYTRRGIEVAVSDQHAFYFTRGTLAVRADLRVAMVHYRPTAFATITGV